MPSQVTNFRPISEPPGGAAKDAIGTRRMSEKDMQLSGESDPFARLNPLPTKCCDASQRHLFCDYYDSCLTLAVKKRWKSFSCKACRAYKATELDAVFNRNGEDSSPETTAAWSAGKDLDY